MDRHAPFFSRNWLDQPREQYQEQLRRLHCFLDSHRNQTEYELIQVKTKNKHFINPVPVNMLMIIHLLSLNLLNAPPLPEPWLSLLHLVYTVCLTCIPDAFHYPKIAISATSLVATPLSCWAQFRLVIGSPWTILAGVGTSHWTLHWPDPSCPRQFGKPRSLFPKKPFANNKFSQFSK